MNMGEYVAYEDVKALNDAEYDSFLDYVRFMGYGVWWTAVDKHNKFNNVVLSLDFDGTLMFAPDTWVPPDFKRISLEEVKRMASMMNSV